MFSFNSKKEKEQNQPEVPAKKKVSPVRIVRKQIDELFTHGASYTMSEMALELNALYQDYPRQVVNELAKRLSTDNDDEERWVAWAFLQLGKTEEAMVKKLQFVLKSKKKPFKARMLAMTLLQQLGVEVDISHVQLKNDADDMIDEAVNLVDEKIEQWLAGIYYAERADQIIQVVQDVDKTIQQLGKANLPIGIITELSEIANTEAVNLLQAMVYVSCDERLMKKAGRALERLEGKSSRAILSSVRCLSGEYFYRAYATDPISDEPETLIFAWKTEGRHLIAFVFLIEIYDEQTNFINDFFVTRSIPSKEFKQHFLNKGSKEGVNFHEIQMSSGQRMLKKALQGNKNLHKPLPEMYQQYAHLVKRWILK